MATTGTQLIPSVRFHLNEVTAKFWTDAELFGWIDKGVRDLWRDIVDLKQEHYLTIDNTNVSLPASTTSLSGVPNDVHKVYMIEPRDVTETGTSRRLIFTPLPYKHPRFAQARMLPAVEPESNTIYYDVTKSGTPVVAPTILVAPTVSRAVNLSFSYVPSVGILLVSDTLPIPGEADNALIAWAVAFARAKEREDRSPDPAWIEIYSSEKQHLMQSLGVRQLQEPVYVDANFEQFWG